MHGKPRCESARQAMHLRCSSTIAESRCVVAPASACRIAPGCKRRAPAPWAKHHHGISVARERWFHWSPGRQDLPPPNDESQDWSLVVELSKPGWLVPVQPHDYPGGRESTMPKPSAIAGLIRPAESGTLYSRQSWPRSWLQGRLRWRRPAREG